jgi:hypothetical protein
MDKSKPEKVNDNEFDYSQITGKNRIKLIQQNTQLYR